MTDNLPTKIDYEDTRMLQTIRDTVAKDATDSEFAMFIGHCRGTKLNPFKREIWFIKTKQGVQIMTGLKGFYAIANSHPLFDGVDPLEYAEDKGRVISVTAKAWRKDRSRPATVTLYASEFAKQYGNWASMPRYMLGKCAEAHALRRAFPEELNDLYIPEEMPETVTPQETDEPHLPSAQEERRAAEAKQAQERADAEMKLAQAQTETWAAVERGEAFLYSPKNITDQAAKRKFHELITGAGGVWDKGKKVYWVTQEQPEIEKMLTEAADIAPEAQNAPV